MNIYFRQITGKKNNSDDIISSANARRKMLSAKKAEFRPKYDYYCQNSGKQFKDKTSARHYVGKITGKNWDNDDESSVNGR